MQVLTTEKEYYDNGILKSEDPSVDGKRHGTYKTWWKNGKPKLFIEYKNGDAHGQTKEWYRNGKLRRVKNYQNNVPHGVCMRIDESGTVSKFYYDRGMFVDFEEDYLEMMADFLRDRNYIVTKVEKPSFDLKIKPELKI